MNYMLTEVLNKIFRSSFLLYFSSWWFKY